jgi:hypothetical protein
MKPLWWLLIGALAFIIAVEWFLPVQEPPVPSYAKQGAAADNNFSLAQADRTVDFLPIEQFHSVKDRPLFFEGRRPPAEYVPDAPAAKPGRSVGKVRPPTASLSGIVRVGDNTYVMLNGVGKQKGMVRTRVGEDVDGWKIERIQDDRVVLKSGEEIHEIPLRAYKPVALPRPKPAKKAAKKNNNRDRTAARKKALAARRAAKKDR